MTTCIVLLSNGYMEYVCIDPWLPALRRHWRYVRTVDYREICLL